MSSSVHGQPCSVVLELWLCDATGMPTRRLRALPPQPVPLAINYNNYGIGDVTFAFNPPAVLMSTRWYAFVVRPTPIDASGEMFFDCITNPDPQADLKDVGWTA